MSARTDLRRLPLALDPEDALEREIEARVRLRLRHEAVQWKLRLVIAEAVMLGLLVGFAGIMLDKPLLPVLRAALIVAGSCLASGLLLLGLSDALFSLRDRAQRAGKARHEH